MKRILTLLLCQMLFSCGESNEEQELSSSTEDIFQNSGNLYFESGICKCPNATVGDQDRIEGTIYTAVDNSTIKAQLDNGEHKFMHHLGDQYVWNLKSICQLFQ